mmetsp:Transcript_17393/g.15304  ORF Transcript_17393/g.15304 Transcript_17393/m.15304 type:complete len:886 (+) Transcript_17393:459-3116(+)
MRRGHEIADLDPLGLSKSEEQSGAVSLYYSHNELDYRHYGFTEDDLNKEFFVNPEHITGILANRQTWKLGELIDNLKAIYCGKVGYEYMHVQSREERNWLRAQIEAQPTVKFSNEEKLTLFDRLCSNESFTNIVKNKFSTSKRFGIEGCDSMISGLHYLIDQAVNADIKRVIFGMPHRGRLNTLAEVIGKQHEEILCEFQENLPVEEEGWGNTGDVKYHLGTTSTKRYENGKKIKLSMLPNPSHLEAVDPLVAGRARAFQEHMGDVNGEKVLPVAIHGDAAIAGQGVVYETLQMWNLDNYKVGGTIHIVCNNQIGFTTVQKDARSGLYCTDIAKSIEAPVFHVNADEPEEVDKVMKLALEYRMKFKKDVFIDLIGYRKYGHNELDQPSFTQPLMYKIVNQKKNVFELYAQRLVEEGVLTQEKVKERINSFTHELEKAYENSRNKKFEQDEWVMKPAADIVESQKHGNPRDTGVKVSLLKDINEKIHVIPQHFKLHPQVKKVYEARHHSLVTGEHIDWATAETMAYATLVHDGYGVRLSGEDVKRGTFSHRHATVFDQNQDQEYTPIQTLLPEDEKHKVTFSNSHLSEFGVLGFEYGYSISNPNILCIWEAQFGDFSNEAQVIIDNFIASGESKWGIQSGITMLLPHGYDGQGPEHSSARLERYLELSDDNPFEIYSSEEYQSDRERPMRETNIQICVPTTASNIFHLLRRQLRRKYRKPLIVMSPKKLLRHKGAVSTLSEFDEGFRFRRVLFEAHPEELVEPKKIKKLVLCSGQNYYELLDARRKRKIDNVALVRLEQLAPFPYDRIREALQEYPNAEVAWCQEEHYNMGAWSFVQPRINEVLKEFKRPNVIYHGRRPSSSAAAGLLKYHFKELEAMLNEVYGKH